MINYIWCDAFRGRVRVLTREPCKIVSRKREKYLSYSFISIFLPPPSPFSLFLFFFLSPRFCTMISKESKIGLLQDDGILLSIERWNCTFHPPICLRSTWIRDRSNFCVICVIRARIYNARNIKHFVFSFFLLPFFSFFFSSWLNIRFDALRLWRYRSLCFSPFVSFHGLEISLLFLAFGERLMMVKWWKIKKRLL